MATSAESPGKGDRPLGNSAGEPGKAPTSDDIRSHLLRRAKDYAALTGLSLGAVSQRCSGEHKFLSLIEAGRVGFTVERYQRAMDWFDANWPSEAAA